MNSMRCLREIYVFRRRKHLLPEEADLLLQQEEDLLEEEDLLLGADDLLLPYDMSSLSRQHMSGLPETQKCVISGTSGVATARHGRIFCQDGATSLRDVSKYLPGLRDAILRPKMTDKVQKSKNPANYIII